MNQKDRADLPKTVVVDVGNERYAQNRLFQKESVKDHRFLQPWVYFFEACEKRNIRLITSDVFLSMPVKPARPLLLSIHMAGNTNRLINQGVHPAIIIADETPLYACRFYFNLKKATGQFDHAFVWRGAKDLLAPRVVFHDAAFHPHPGAELPVEGNFERRKYLVMVNRNNRIHRLRRLYAYAANFFKPLPTLVNRELYSERLRALDFFSRHSAIDLYGEGWEKPVKYTAGKYAASIQRCYRGYVPDKLATLRGYRFSITFENTVMGGLVTEKLIESLWAGCIPVYLGAPDITDYIPATVFIDMRQFKSYASLDQYLRSFTEEKYDQFIRNINDFLASEKYLPFTQEQFANTLITIIESYS